MFMIGNQYIEWCIEQHRKTNHYYDDYLPYEFHLRMVNTAYQNFKHLIDDPLREVVGYAVWGHDLIEDTRVSYNDVRLMMGESVAGIVYAVTNEKGKNRKERANDKYYEGIRNTPGATFVKLCDRIANVQYSKLTKSRMFEMYKRENSEFLEKVGADQYLEMKEYLVKLFEY